MTDPDQQFEQKLKELVPTPASPELKSRIASQLGGGSPSAKTIRFRRNTTLGIGLAAAASIALGVKYSRKSVRVAQPQEASATGPQEKRLLSLRDTDDFPARPIHEQPRLLREIGGATQRALGNYLKFP